MNKARYVRGLSSLLKASYMIGDLTEDQIDQEEITLETLALTQYAIQYAALGQALAEFQEYLQKKVGQKKLRKSLTRFSL